MDLFNLENKNRTFINNELEFLTECIEIATEENLYEEEENLSDNVFDTLTSIYAISESRAMDILYRAGFERNGNSFYFKHLKSKSY